jgi:hypothetical protein
MLKQDGRRLPLGLPLHSDVDPFAVSVGGQASSVLASGAI